MTDAHLIAESIRRLRRLYVEQRGKGLDIANTVAKLKNEGANPPITIKIVCDVEEDLDIDAAQNIVMNSDSWKDEKEFWEKFWKDTEWMLSEPNSE